MLIIKALDEPIKKEIENSQSLTEEVTHTHIVEDTQGVFSPITCCEDFDILAANIDLLSQQAENLAAQKHPRFIDYNGHQFSCSQSMRYELKDKSELYAGDEKFVIESINGPVIITAFDAVEIRKLIEKAVNANMLKLVRVKSAISELTMKGIETFDLNKEWEIV